MSTIDSDPPESVRSAWQKAIVTDIRAKAYTSRSGSRRSVIHGVLERPVEMTKGYLIYQEISLRITTHRNGRALLIYSRV
jgi:hypothetical protein